MTRRLAALACALLLVTAGCAGIGGQNDATTTAPTQTTSTEATDTTTTESSEQLAPGVTAEGVEDARALADAHRAILEDAQFVKHEAVTRANESTTATWNRTFVVENESVWRLTTTGEGVGVALDVTNGTQDIYADGERALWRLDDDATGNTSYGVRYVTVDDGVRVLPSEEVFETNDFQRFYDRGLVYTLAASADSVEALDADAGAVELSGSTSDLPTAFTRSGDAEYTATVTADGLVRSIELSYPSGDATAELAIEFDTDVTDPVEQPDWYETALNETVANQTDA